MTDALQTWQFPNLWGRVLAEFVKMFKNILEWILLIAQP